LGIGVFQNSNVCAAYRRKEFLLLGGFPSPVVCNEDMLVAAKAVLAGYKISYTAEAVVLHSHNYAYKDLFKRYFDIAASLDCEQVIRRVGKTEAKGYDFLIEQVKYLKARHKLRLLPQVLLEAVAKYTGYKLGERHSHIPEVCKKHFGLNKVFWTNQISNKKNI
jgi:rhamnosyltransferase